MDGKLVLQNILRVELVYRIFTITFQLGVMLYLTEEI